jgi:hypothetical protein
MNTQKLTRTAVTATRSARILCLFLLFFGLANTALAGITLRLDGTDYSNMSSSYIAPADHTVHVLSVPNQLPLICAPQGTPEGNMETSLVLRLDYVDIPLSANVQISHLAGETLISATSVDGVLVCTQNTNDEIFTHSFE